METNILNFEDANQVSVCLLYEYPTFKQQSTRNIEKINLLSSRTTVSHVPIAPQNPSFQASIIPTFPSRKIILLNITS